MPPATDGGGAIVARVIACVADGMTASTKLFEVLRIGQRKAGFGDEVLADARCIDRIEENEQVVANRREDVLGHHRRLNGLRAGTPPGQVSNPLGELPAQPLELRRLLRRERPRGGVVACGGFAAGRLVDEKVDQLPGVDLKRLDQSVA